MHKYYLTDQECMVIQNAEDIIRDLGGFPSMENGELIGIEICHNPTSGRIGNESRISVSLTFDIEVWMQCVEHLGRVVNNKHKRIKMQFDGINGFRLDSMAIWTACGEIKFGNERYPMRQDSVPEVTYDVPRPYSSFYIRSGSGVVLYFSESECIISAEFI